MLDKDLFREGADLEVVRKSQRGRFSIVSKQKALDAAKASKDPAEIGAAQQAYDEALKKQNVSFVPATAAQLLRSNPRTRDKALGAAIDAVSSQRRHKMSKLTL